MFFCDSDNAESFFKYPKGLKVLPDSVCEKSLPAESLTRIQFLSLFVEKTQLKLYAYLIFERSTFCFILGLNSLHTTCALHVANVMIMKRDPNRDILHIKLSVGRIWYNSYYTRSNLEHCFPPIQLITRDIYGSLEPQDKIINPRQPCGALVFYSGAICLGVHPVTF